MAVLRIATESEGTPAEEQTAFAGLPALAALLPHAVSPRGLLVEWLSEGSGSGVVSLAARSVLQQLEQTAWAVIDPDGDFFPAMCGWSPSMSRPLVLRPGSAQDLFWTVEQCLRCPGLGLTWCRVERAPPLVLRRWKLAAETGGGTGFLFRPASARKQPTWADLRWLVTTQPGTAAGRRWRIETLYCRGGFSGAAVILEQHHATGAVRVVAELGSATGAPRTPQAARAGAGAVC
ncbi:MAG: hypothetical protein SFV23_26570 [Planctomycetaceae bacterium]|nr:hypothetical protein [Planctomycetaceae bacterium]